jgi:EpsI family protein
MKSPRFWTVVALLAGTALIAACPRRFRSDSRERALVAASARTIAGWLGSDVAIDPETLDVLGAGDFLSRVYTRNGAAQPIGLLSAIFPTQRTGVTIHSPKNCLPGAGWAFESSRYVNLNDADGKAHRVGEYIIANGENRQFVIYWYQAHGRSVANEYMAKIYLVTDAMRLNRTDGALVRVITPIGSREGESLGKGKGGGDLQRSLYPCSLASFRTERIEGSTERQHALAKDFRLYSYTWQPARMEDSERSR